jgi:hypothetical protein
MGSFSEEAFKRFHQYERGIGEEFRIRRYPSRGSVSCRRSSRR